MMRPQGGFIDPHQQTAPDQSADRTDQPPVRREATSCTGVDAMHAGFGHQSGASAGQRFGADIQHQLGQPGFGKAGELLPRVGQRDEAVVALPKRPTSPKASSRSASRPRIMKSSMPKAGRPARPLPGRRAGGPVPRAGG